MLLEVNKHNMMTELVIERGDKMIIAFQDQKLHISIWHTPPPNRNCALSSTSTRFGKRSLAPDSLEFARVVKELKSIRLLQNTFT